MKKIPNKTRATHSNLTLHPVVEVTHDLVINLWIVG